MPAPLNLIDSHCHLDFQAFDATREKVLASCAAVGVSALIVPGVRHGDWPRLLALCDQYPNLYPALGLHPCFAASHQATALDALDRLLRHQRPVAVGEIGLDYWEGVDNSQLPLLTAQLRLAREHELPVILHVRKAHDQVLQQLRKQQLSRAGVVHAFSGSAQQAAEYLKLGFKLGFGGALTYERAHKLRRLAAELPLDSIVLETDAPDMPMAGMREEPNRPDLLPRVLQVLSLLRPESSALIAEITTRNTTELFGLAGQADGAEMSDVK